MGTNCAPLVTEFVFILLRERFNDLFLMIIMVCLDDILNIDHPYFEGKVI